MIAIVPRLEQEVKVEGGASAPTPLNVLVYIVVVVNQVLKAERVVVFPRLAVVLVVAVGVVIVVVFFLVMVVVLVVSVIVVLTMIMVIVVTIMVIIVTIMVTVVDMAVVVMAVAVMATVVLPVRVTFRRRGVQFPPGKLGSVQWLSTVKKHE